MPTATRITATLEGKAGEAYGYALSEPYEGVEYLIVSAIDWPTFGLRETRITPASKLVHDDGTEQIVMLVTGDQTMALSIELPLCTHAEALESIGYTEVVA